MQIPTPFSLGGCEEKGRSRAVPSSGEGVVGLEHVDARRERRGGGDFRVGDQERAVGQRFQTAR